MVAFLRGNPRFLRYWISTWASELGDWVRNMTLMYLVLDLSGGSAVAVSYNNFCEFAPIFFFGLFVGVFADRWDRKKTIMSALFLRVVMIGVLIVGVSMRQLWMIYTVAFVSAIFTLFFRAPGFAFTMQFVPEEDRQKAATYRQMSTSWMFIIGPMIGTALYYGLGGPMALGLTITLFLIALLMISTIRVEAAHEASRSQKGIEGVLVEMKDGFRYSWQNKLVRPILFSNVFLGIGAGLVNVLSIFLVTEFLGLSQAMFSVLVTVQGAGMVVSSLLVAKWKNMRSEHMISYGMLLEGVGMIVSVGYKNFVVVCAGVVLVSLGMIMFNIGMATLMQTKVDFAYQGRLGTTVMSINNGTMMLAMLFAGYLHNLFTVRPVIFGGGVSNLVAGVLCIIMYAKWASSRQEQEINLQG